MEIKWRKIDELIPYERNQKKHDKKQIQNVANSIKRFNWQQPIVVDKKDVVIIGHCRLEAAKLLGLDTVPVTCADNLSEDEVRELRIADNKTNESPWDMELLAEDAEELSFEGFDFGFAFIDDSTDSDEKYTTKTSVPQYDITGENPVLGQLYDKSKAEELMQEIELADAPDDVKDFLNIAASRHVVFNYKEIAEYYAHAPANIQQLMERSALVIIDIDDAIANGYAKLHDEIGALMAGDADA